MAFDFVSSYMQQRLEAQSPNAQLNMQMGQAFIEDQRSATKVNAGLAIAQLAQLLSAEKAKEDTAQSQVVIKALEDTITSITPVAG